MKHRLFTILLLVLLHHETISAFGGGGGRCNRRCGGATSPYPLGFSAGCPIALSCDANGSVPILPYRDVHKGAAFSSYRVISFNSAASTIVVSLPLSCSRGVADARAALSGPNYGVLSRTGLFLRGGCRDRGSDSSNASAAASGSGRCSVPAAVMSRLLHTAQCGENGGNDTSAASVACVDSASSNATGAAPDLFLRWEKVENLTCDDVLTSSVWGDTSEGTALEFGVAELGWWLDGTCAGERCAANAACSDVVTPSGGQGHRCECGPGMAGDGFVGGDGCYWLKPLGINRTGTKIILIVLTSAAATLLFLCIYVSIWHRKGKRLRFLLCKKTSSSTEMNYEAIIVSYGSLAPERYKYSEVTKITSSLNSKLGEGGYGVVFKGRLHDGRLVAVKFLHYFKGKGEEFVNEVISIGRTSHVNIVSLFGFCLEGSKRALIYEYMPNGSLDKYIYSENPKEILGWEKLYTVATGIARGLEYLHHGCNTRIIHFDIKPQNILLDQDFCPKIADFGLAKLCRTKESKLSMTGARGTIGFIAPEVLYRTFGDVSTKSDVYSYGMMLLEIVGGRKNAKSIAGESSAKYFPHWIYDHFAQDEGLRACEVTSETDEIAKKMTLIGLWCIQVLPVQRPTITEVLEMFERSLDELDMPPKQNFSQLFEDSAHSTNVRSASSTSPSMQSTTSC